MTLRPAILQVIPELGTGGAELSTLEIVDALSTIGVRALVATQGGRMAQDVERLGGEIIPMAVATKNPLQMFRNKKKIEQIIVEQGIVLLHARSRAPAWSSLLASTKTKIPFVTTYHGAYGEMEPFKRLYNSVMARGDMVIANSQFTADLVRSRHHTDEKRLRVIYRGVDTERFCRAAISGERLENLRAQWGAVPGQKIILHPARLTRWKGQGVVIDAIRQLVEQGRDQGALVVLAGDHQGRSEYVSELQRQITACGLVDQVRLVGHCSDMAAAYALADVAIIASIEPEAFGRTSAEAQAMGCSVIATNIGAPPETVRATPVVREDEKTGWLVPPDEPDMLARALASSLGLETAARQQLAERAIANVAQNFSDELMKNKTLAVYDELLGTDFVHQYAGQKKPLAPVQN